MIVSIKFDMISDVLGEPFSVSTPVGDSVVVNKVYNGCPISYYNRVTVVDLIELDMIDFYIILGIDLLHSIFSSIDCRTR